MKDDTLICVSFIPRTIVYLKRYFGVFHLQVVWGDKELWSFTHIYFIKMLNAYEGNECLLMIKDESLEYQICPYSFKNDD